MLGLLGCSLIDGFVCFLLGNSMASAYRRQGNYPEESTHSEHGESLKSRNIDGYLHFRVILCLTLQGSLQ